MITASAIGSATVAKTESSTVGEPTRPYDRVMHPRETDVAIVGAGFGGLAMAIALERAGTHSYTVLERAADVGGTWLANSYPGAQCDVPSNLYSFSFAPNPAWTHSYPEQPQILAYLRDCAERFGVRPHIRLRTEVLDARWDDAARRWEIDTSGGSLSARFLVAAPGLLSEPRTPDVPGLDGFTGTVMHSAAWDHDVDLRGRHVALVGTGASAIQIGPRIQPEVERLYVHQRTPPWVFPHRDREIGERLRRLYAARPATQRLARTAVYWMRETLLPPFMRPSLAKPMEVIARAHIRRQVSDPALREAVTPGYEIGCKRILLSDDWYPMLEKRGVELRTSGLAEVRGGTLVATDGREHDADTIIFATGFTPTEPPLARRLHGRGGRSLADAWDGAMRAYKGISVAGFPNMFLLYGPNTNLAHSSIVFMLESQVAYVADALRALREHGADAAEVRADAQDAWNEWVQRELEGSVWNTGGCASWYFDRNGDNPIMWPGSTLRFRRLTRRFDAAAYSLA
jgi:cation diffusion facilitator CzcD-associated flavoprotein CzcO